ncbi:Putative secreted protein [Fulvivirga imtechensis AK7]|uniref:Putative secreted protein n=1 Tax=Fulvivirga imtechensis AK7 TaxID=1237149 RepID=L8JPU3_9BACT|nr:NAD(P)-binding domain-containing protein [Fulvivirga imtechensis]ELR70218.1 Putative secreted protein [Fulvivirga imtechensis AK7]
MTVRDYPVAIIGAGPVGMAAAAHLKERNIPFIIFESGGSVGANLLDWGHVRVFSPWKYNINKAAEKLLQEMNWQKPDEDKLPTGREIVEDYLLPLSFHPQIKPFLRLSSKVVAITRKRIDKMRTSGRENQPFIIQVNEKEKRYTYEASAVIDASGTWKNPNPLGAGGVFAEGELEHADRIRYRIPDILGKDKKRYANKHVAVVGSGHSAINTLLDLATLREEYPETRMTWILRAENLSAVYGGKEDDALEARGALGIRIEKLVNSGHLEIYTPFLIQKISAKSERLSIEGYTDDKLLQIFGVDEIIANTGARPDLSMLREVRVQVDVALESVPELAELIDPNIHSCGTVRPHGELELRQPESNFYVVGAKSYGRAPTFLMATGYEQVRSIAAWLDGDAEAAKRVELELPETGVCSTDAATGVACCGPAVVANEEENNNAGACCSPSKNDNLNMKAMEKIEKNVLETSAAEGCCGGAPTDNEEACCKLDEEKKAEGEAGCGCNSVPEKEREAKVASCC